jgi:5'-3' exonuclease
LPGTILVDANSVGYAYHRATKLTVGAFQTQAIFGVFKAVRTLYAGYPDRSVYVLWDGRSERRLALYPDYKGNRKTEDMAPKDRAVKEAYKAQVPFTQALLARCGVPQLLYYDMEADDLGGYLSKRLPTPMLLVTGDRDWQQLIRPGVTWLEHREDRKVNVDNFFETTGYKTREGFLQGKALQGDTSDNIKGVGGIGEKGAPEFIATYGSVDAFRRTTLPGVKLPAAHQRLLSDPDTYARFERNMKLMDLLTVPAPDPAKRHEFNRGYNAAAVRAICDKLAFISITKDFDNFMRVFAERHADTERKAA